MFLQSKESALKRPLEGDGSTSSCSKKKKKKQKAKRHKIHSPEQSVNSQGSQHSDKKNKMPQMTTGAVNTNGQQHLSGNSKAHRISAWVDSVDNAYAPSEQGTYVSSPTHSGCHGADYFNSVGDFLFLSSQEQNEVTSRPIKQLNKRMVNSNKYNNNVKTPPGHPSPLSQKGSVSNGVTQTGSSNVRTPFSPLSHQQTDLGVNSDKTDTGQKLPTATAHEVQSSEDMQLDNQFSFHGLVNDHGDVGQDRAELVDNEIAMEVDNCEELEDQIRLEVKIIVNYLSGLSLRAVTCKTCYH